MFSNSRVESRERAFFQGNAEWMRIRRDVGSRVFGRPADWSQPVSAAEVVALPELLEEAAVEETHSDLDEDEDEEDEQGSSSGAPLDEEAWDELQRRGTEVEADASLDEDGAVAPDESVPGSHGGGDAVAEALAASAAIAGGSSRRVVEWAAVQDAPVVSLARRGHGQQADAQDDEAAALDAEPLAAVDGAEGRQRGRQCRSDVGAGERVLRLCVWHETEAVPGKHEDPGPVQKDADRHDRHDAEARAADVVPGARVQGWRHDGRVTPRAWTGWKAPYRQPGHPSNVRGRQPYILDPEVDYGPGPAGW